MLNICELARERMRPEDIDHHSYGSDLYLRVNDISRELVAQYDNKWMVETFIDNIDHVLWYDIPFAWVPEEEA